LILHLHSEQRANGNSLDTLVDITSERCEATPTRALDLLLIKARRVSPGRPLMNFTLECHAQMTPWGSAHIGPVNALRLMDFSRFRTVSFWVFKPFQQREVASSNHVASLIFRDIMHCTCTPHHTFADSCPPSPGNQPAGGRKDENPAYLRALESVCSRL